MSFNECNYIVRHVFDKHVFMPGYGNIISRLAKLYATNKEAYNRLINSEADISNNLTSSIITNSKKKSIFTLKHPFRR